MLTKHPHTLQACSPPRQRELSLNYTKQIGSINIFFLNGYIKIKMNGNCFSIRGDGRHGAEPAPGPSPYPPRTETPASRAQGEAQHPHPPRVFAKWPWSTAGQGEPHGTHREGDRAPVGEGDLSVHGAELPAL